jgi:uncharacterized protein YuzE
MKLTVDHEADALYLNLTPDQAVESEEIAPGIVLDYDANDRVVGIEMLHLSQRAPKAETDNVVFTCIQHLAGLGASVREESKAYGA